MLKQIALVLSKRFRMAKYELFLRQFAPEKDTTVLDVGVANSGYGSGAGWQTANFFEAPHPWPERITAVGLRDFQKFKVAFPTVHCVTADGRSLPFPDKSFDLVFCNAVVEHVGEEEDQQLSFVSFAESERGSS